MKISTRHLSLVGIALFAWILYRADLGALWQTLRGASPYFLAVGLGTVVLEVAIRTLRWKTFSSIYSDKYGYKDAGETYLIGVAFGAVTPGKIGDVVKIVDLDRKTGIGLPKALALEIMDRIVDLVFLFVAGLASFVYVVAMIGGLQGSMMVVLAAVVAFLALAVFALHEKSVVIFRPLYNYLVPQRHKPKAKQAYEAFRQGIRDFAKVKWSVPIVLLTAAGWLVLFARPYFFGLGIGAELPLLSVIAFMPLVMLVELLPVSVMGIGTREAALIFLFGLLGVSAEVMLLIGLMLLTLSYLPQIALGYLFAIRKNLNISNLG